MSGPRVNSNVIFIEFAESVLSPLYGCGMIIVNDRAAAVR